MPSRASVPKTEPGIRSAMTSIEKGDYTADSPNDEKRSEKEDVNDSSVSAHAVETSRAFGSTEEERAILQQVFKRATVFSLVSDAFAGDLEC